MAAKSLNSPLPTSTGDKKVHEPAKRQVNTGTVWLFEITLPPGHQALLELQIELLRADLGTP